MFDRLKKLLDRKDPSPVVEDKVVSTANPAPVVEDKVVSTAKEDVADKPKKAKRPRTKKLSEKDQATKNKQPWHDIKLITNPSDPRNGYFQMDWNPYHIEALRGMGYEGKTEEDVIEAWIRDISRSVAMEDSEILDYMARPRVQSKRNDNGTTEYS